MGGTEFPNPVLRALLFALLCFLGPFMDTFRCCSRTVKCGTALTATSDVSVTDCGHEYCTGCLLKLQETTPYCEVCDKKVGSWTRTWRVFPRQSSRTSGERGEGEKRTETSYAFPRSSLGGVQDFMRTESTGDREAHVMVAWKERSSGDDGPRRTFFVSETIGGGGTDQRRALGALAVALRTALLEPDAAAQQLPVVDLDGLVDRALSDPSDMAHFFRVLADPHATFDKEVSGEPDGAERRHALAAYVSLELMRVQVEREHSHPLRDWMSRTLNAQGASSNTISVLTKLSIAAKEASSNIAYHEGDEFSSLRAQERERAFHERLSLKLHDFDNIGFTKKGKKVGYEQFIASAWKEYTFHDLVDLGCFDEELDNTPKEQASVLPSASSFGRRIEDVKLMAARWKDNLEACLKLYPIIIAMAPEIFSAVKVSPGDHHGLLSASEGTASSSDEKVMIPTAAAGNAAMARATTTTTTTTTTTALINEPEDDDGRLDEELREEETQRFEVSRKSADQYSSSVRTQVLHKDLASKEVVHFLMYYSMWMAQVGQYQAEDSATLMANLSSLNTSVLAWFDLDISTDEKVRALMAIDDAERSRLEGISQDDAGGSGGKNADWLRARAPNGICRQTGSAIDRARRKQPSHLKSQVGVAPDGTEVKAWGATASMQYGTDHEKDGFAGVQAFFDDWFKTTYCVQYGIEYSECEIAYEGDMGIFVWEADNTFAYSPDGRITVTLPDEPELVWLVEIKCPPSKKDYDTTSLSPILGEHNIPGVEGKQPLTSAYYCQVQLGMQILNIQSTIFAVWTEKHTVNSKESVQVQFIERNQPFIDAMMSDAGDYFWNHYIPRLRALQTDVANARRLALEDGGSDGVGDDAAMEEEEAEVVAATRAKRGRDGGSSGSGSGSSSSSSSSSGSSHGDGSSSSSSGRAKKNRGGKRKMTPDEEDKMKSLSRFIVMCADGAPVAIIRRFYDEEAEANAAAAAAAANEAAVAGARKSTEVSAGGFHFGKETYTMNGHEYGAVFLRHLVSIIRPSEGQQKWFLDPPDPRQRQAEEAEYYIGMLLALVHETATSAAPGGVTWIDVHNHLLDRCRDSVAGPMVYKVTEYFRHADVSFLVRDSEKRVKRHGGWKLFQAAHRLSRSTLFTNNNAHKYIRIGNDEQIDMDTRSDFFDYVWGTVVFLEVTANGHTIFRDRWVENMVKDIRTRHGHTYDIGVGKQLVSTVANMKEWKHLRAQGGGGGGGGGASSLSAAASNEELEERRERAGSREVALSKEVVVGIQYAVAHRLFAKGQLLVGGKKMSALASPFCHLQNGEELNGAMLQTLYRGDDRLLKYTQKWYFDSERPSNRPGESSGDFYPVPRTMKDVKIWEQFFKERRESTDEKQLYEHHIGNIVLMSKSLALSTIERYRDKYDVSKRGEIPAKLDSNASKPDIISRLVAVRKNLVNSGVDLSDAFRAAFPPPAGAASSPVADPPAAVPLDKWPLLADRGDGKQGSPIDHELISFSPGILAELTSGEDMRLGGAGGGGGGVGRVVSVEDDSRNDRRASVTSLTSMGDQSDQDWLMSQ